MGKMLLSISLTLVSNFDFDSECLVVNINIQNQDWQISFSKSKLNIQDYALGCQYQDSNSRFKSCISRLVLNFNICKFAWQYSIPKSKSLQTSNSTSISRILSISTSISTNINQSCPPLVYQQIKDSILLYSGRTPMYFVHCAVVSTTAQWTIYYCTVDSCIPMDCLPGSDRWTSQLPCWAIQQHSYTIYPIA